MSSVTFILDSDDSRREKAYKGSLSARAIWKAFGKFAGGNTHARLEVDGVAIPSVEDLKHAFPDEIRLRSGTVRVAVPDAVHCQSLEKAINELLPNASIIVGHRSQIGGKRYEISGFGARSANALVRREVKKIVFPALQLRLPKVD